MAKTLNFTSGADIVALKNSDRKQWQVISCPTTGVRFDLRMLELMDTDGDGRIRTPEVLAAVEFLLQRGIDLDTLFNPDEKLKAELDELLKRPQDAARDDDERAIRYQLHLREFLENFVNLKRLYNGEAMFLTGVLRMDGRDMTLCSQVGDEEAHAALAEKSNCCIIYVKLTRPSEEQTTQMCAVVTAGTVAGLYVGRNGVFYDRDGRDWEAVITKVVEAQVSLVEAFWAPWRKIGNGITEMIKKFLGDKEATVTASAPNGAALASSVAAIGIGVGMVGAAFASLVAAFSRATPLRLALSVAALVLIVSLPSVLLTWFKLRKRDLGAVLNASGWAVNLPIHISLRLARKFTRVA